MAGDHGEAGARLRQGFRLRMKLRRTSRRASKPVGVWETKTAENGSKSRIWGLKIAKNGSKRPEKAVLDRTWTQIHANGAQVATGGEMEREVGVCAFCGVCVEKSAVFGLK